MHRVGFSIAFCFVCLTLLAQNSQAADTRPIVAVFDVDGIRAKLSKAFLGDLADYLSTKLTESGRYTVIPRDQLRLRLTAEKSKTYQECFDQSCQIELGKDLAAEKTLSTKVMKMGRRCTVTLTLYDLKRSTTEVAASKHGPCGENGVLETVDGALAKLFGEDVSLPAEGGGAKVAAGTDDKQYKRDLAKAWRKLAKDVKRGTSESKLEKYQAFLADYPTDNPHADKVQKNIDALEAKLERQEAARVKAEENKAALAAKRKGAQALKAAYGVAKATKGRASKQLVIWEKFIAEYPDQNPYLKTAKRKISALKVQANKEIPPGAPGKAGIEWMKSAPTGLEFTRTEITQSQYRACMKAGKCTKPDTKQTQYGNCDWDPAKHERHPVACVDWHQATAFCAWAGGRLPSWPEWYNEASNGGKRKFAWGDEKPSCKRVVMANDRHRRKGTGCGRKSTWPVCSKKKGTSVSGLCDMSGNVSEWTSSLAYKTGDKRSMCGGSYGGYMDKHLATASVSGVNPKTRFFGVGIRCVRDGNEIKAVGSHKPSARLTYQGITADRVGTQSKASPDGKKDGSFVLELDSGGKTLRVDKMELSVSDAKGKTWRKTWDTVAGGHWILGVEKDGKRLNASDVPVQFTLMGKTSLNLWVAADTYTHQSKTFSYFTKGGYFTARVFFKNHPPIVITTRLK